MKVRFLVDSEDPCRWDDAEDCESSGRATNHWVNTRHAHEFMNFKDTFYDTFSSKCSAPHRKFLHSVLIDLPDEVMFQYMMDGFEDDSFLVYNPYTEKLAISNDINSAADEAQRIRDNQGRNLKGSYSSPTDDSLMFDWNLESGSELDVEKVQTRNIEGEFYNLIWGVVKPYVLHWYTVNFLHVPYTLEYYIRKLYYEVTSTGIVLSHPYEVVPCDSSPEDKKKVPMKVGTLYFIVQQYMNDGDFYTQCSKYFTESDIELYRMMCVYLNKKITESWDE